MSSHRFAKYALAALSAFVFAACGGHHQATTNLLAPSTPQLSPGSMQSLPGLKPSADDSANWPTDQEMLQRYLEARTQDLSENGKGASSALAPLGDEVKVKDLQAVNIDGQLYLQWHYLNPGDYNQDGTVNAFDVTTLAMHFGQNIADNPEAAVADGNGDGVVGISDLQPLAQYRYRTCYGYALLWSPDSPDDLSNDANYVEIKASLDTDGLLIYRCRFPSDAEYGWYSVAPYFTEWESGPQSEPIYYTPVDGAPIITGIEPPNEAFDYYTEVTFKASFTAAQPYNVKWDFGPDSYFPSFFDGAFSPTQVVFTDNGVKRCSFTVENALGKAVFPFSVKVGPTYSPPLVTGVTPTNAHNVGTQVTYSCQGDLFGDAEFYWDFGGATEPQYSLERSPEVTMINPGKYYASVLVANEWGYSVYRWIIEVTHSGYEVEPNDTFQQADALLDASVTDSFTLKGSIGSADVADWYRISSPPARLIEANCDEGVIVRVYDSHLAEIPESVGTKDNMLYLRFITRKQGAYYIQVTPLDAGVDTSYTLTVTSKAWRLYSELSTENYRTPPAEELKFPLDNFSGHIFVREDGHYFDLLDSYEFDALAGDHLDLNVGIQQLVGSTNGLTIQLDLENPVTGYEYYYRVDQIDKATVIDVHLPYAGTYMLEFWRMPSIGTDIEYDLNGTLSHNEPGISYISPLNVTVGTPTAFTGYAPGAEGWTYSWDFGPGAVPQTSSVHVPRATFNTPGMHACKLSISNGGPVTYKDFTVNVDEWHRQVVSYVEDTFACVPTLVYDGSGTLNLCTMNGKHLQLFGGQWVQDTEFPSRGAIWDTALAVDSSGSLVIASSWNPALTLLTDVGGTWEEEVVDADTYTGQYTSIVLGSQGMLSAVYYARPEGSVQQIRCARQTAGGWDLHAIGEGDLTRNPSLATDSLGNPWVSYNLESYDGSLFHLARWDGAQWVDEAVPMTLGGQPIAKSSCIYFDAADNPHIVFNTPSPSEIRHVWRDTDWHWETAMGVNGFAWKSNFSVVQDSQLQPWMLIYSYKTLVSERSDIGVLRQDAGVWVYEPVVYQNSGKYLGDLALDANDKPHISYVEADTRSVMHLWRD